MPRLGSAAKPPTATYQIRVRHYRDMERAAGDAALLAYVELYFYNGWDSA